MNNKIIEWILRVAVAGEFLGHGVFAIQGKKQWIEWTAELSWMSVDVATQFIFWVGVVDIIIAIIVLVKPIRIALLWAVLWGFWTALVRPLVGEPIWDFIERWANWGAPLALLLLQGWPTTFGNWFRTKDKQQ